MKLKKTTINNNPYLGVNSFVTEEFCLVPSNILKKEEKVLKEYFKETKIIKTSINQSPLLGVFSIGLKDKIVVGTDDSILKEIDILEKEKIKVKVINDYNALGNLICLNSNYGFAADFLKDQTIKEISSFLKVDIEKKNIAGIDLIGSSLYVNDHLFLVNPNISEIDYKYISKKLKVKGIPITLNYGGSFVGNDAIGNREVLFIGNKTSNAELLRIDDLIVDIK
ncbi:MAG: hypothetical protein PHR26_02585 [Candidatus ainarchaeum sp.]|nr:hypothetical protein [Candidatus ainarchaeum sp.]MDD3976163.1 hypothetical protein [Candidatus ainarchaeum sp.]